MKEYILKRYRVRRKRLELVNQTNELKKVEDLLDDIITYKALLLENPDEARRFKKNNIDNRREGIFKTRVRNGLKIEIPEV